MSSKVDVEHVSNVAVDLSIQQATGKYCDVCICVEEKRFLAHKCVLSANSKKLDKLILDALGQKSSNHDIEIEIQGVSSVGFETLLKYFYTGVLNLSPETVMTVWMTAAFLELPIVIKICNEFCQQSVLSVSSHLADDINKVSVVISDKDKKECSTSSISNCGEPIETDIVASFRVNDSSALPTVEGELEESSRVILTTLRNATVDSLALGEINQTTCNSEWSSSNKQVTNEKDTFKLAKSVPISSISHQPKTTVVLTQTSAGKLQRGSSDKICDLKRISNSGCEDIMLEVERLRMQHEQLQLLQLQNKVNLKPALSALQSPHSSSNSTQPPAKKQRKKLSLPELDITETNRDPVPCMGNGLPDAGQLHVIPAFTKSPGTFKFISEQYKDELYNKYTLKKEPPMDATCTAEELLQKGKPRSRKSYELNALNNTIRMILDALSIVDSADPSIEDAVILIMDKFQSLRSSINNPTIRRNLLVKVRHSIHCKKWRMKKQMMKDISTPSLEEFTKIAVKNEISEDSLHG